jgi:hypothetical protein
MLIFRSCFHIFALSCCMWSTLVRWCPSPSAAIVAQLVTRSRARGQADLACKVPPRCRLPSFTGTLASLVTRFIGWSRMSLRSTVVVSVRGRYICFDKARAHRRVLGSPLRDRRRSRWQPVGLMSPIDAELQHWPPTPAPFRDMTARLSRPTGLSRTNKPEITNYGCRIRGSPRL